MYKFTFNRGIWEDGNSLADWLDNEDFFDYLKRIGYATLKTSFGQEFGSRVEIYESSNGGAFYADVSPSGNTSFEVFLPDFPSLMMFIRDHGSAFSAASTNSSQQEILDLLGKLFQVQHGHPVNSICEQCDPVGWVKSVRANEERLKKIEAES